MYSALMNTNWILRHIELDDGAIVGVMSPIHKFGIRYCGYVCYHHRAVQGGTGWYRVVQDISPLIKVCGNHAKPDRVSM